jgi:hypothetical protein
VYIFFITFCVVMLWKYKYLLLVHGTSFCMKIDVSLASNASLIYLQCLLHVSTDEPICIACRFSESAGART